MKVEIVKLKEVEVVNVDGYFKAIEKIIKQFLALLRMLQCNEDKV